MIMVIFNVLNPNLEDDMNLLIDTLNKNNKENNNLEEYDEFPRKNSKQPYTNNNEFNKPNISQKHSYENYNKDSHDNFNRGEKDRLFNNNRKDRDRGDFDSYRNLDLNYNNDKRNKYSFEKNNNNYKDYEPVQNYDYQKYKDLREPKTTHNEYSSPKSPSKTFEKNDLIKDSYQNPFTIVAEKKNPLAITKSQQIFFEGKEKVIEKLDINENLSPMNSKLDYKRHNDSQTLKKNKKDEDSTFKYEKDEDPSILKPNNNLDNSNLNTIAKKKYKGNTQHSFEVTIEKLINIPILKTIDRPYIKLKFFSDYDYVKSDSLVYSNVENSTIDVDMKSTHSIFLNNTEKIKDYIYDFNIFIAKTNTIEEDIIGKASITAEDILNLLNSKNKEELLTSTVYIYGTKKVYDGFNFIIRLIEKAYI